MECRFILKDRNKKTAILINLFVFKSYGQYKYSTGLKVIPTQWNFEDQRFKNTAKNPTAIDTNLKLTNMGQAALKIIYRYENEAKVLTGEIFREEMNKIFKPELKIRNKPLFIESMLEWFEMLAAKKGRREMTSKHTCVVLIQKYFPDWKRLTFEDVTPHFFEKFREYLIMEEGFKLNYIANLTRDLKQFMKYAQLQGKHTNIAYQSFEKVREEADNVSLSKDELIAIEKLSLPKSYELTRDCFLIQCYTGLRHSDLIKLNNSSIQDGLIIVRTQKTDTIIAVPIHQKVREILKKYNGFPKVPVGQTMNKGLKDICQAAKINRPVTIRHNHKGEKISKEYMAWELVSTHTGRRTALTLMYLDGIDLLSLTKISGHKLVKQLQSYLKIESQESASNLKNHKFFQ